MDSENELRSFIVDANMFGRNDRYYLTKRTDSIDRQHAILIQAVDALTWATNRIEELEAENARLMRLLS